MAEEFTIRQGAVEDAEIVVSHRCGMFRDMGFRDDDAMKQMADRFRPWLVHKMQASEYLTWFAVNADGEVVAGLGMWLMDWPPHLIGTGPPRANILNVYTRPECRRKGLAKKLLDRAIEWCRANGVGTLSLHASPAGRPIYEAAGFKPTTEMRLVL